MAIIEKLNCYKLVKGVKAAECGQPYKPGLDGKCWLINYSDIDRQLTVVNDNVISELILKDGALAYEFVSLDESTIGSLELVDRTYDQLLSHSIELRVMTKNQLVKNWANSTLNSRVMVLVKNLDERNPEVAYELYGFDSGMVLSAFTGTTEVADGIVYDITYSSDDVSQEGQVPKSVWTGTLAGTLEMIDALTAPPAPPAGD